MIGTQSGTQVGTQMKYLQLRNSTYYFRYRVPLRFRGCLPLKEVKLSLRTDSFAQAVARIAPKLRIIKRIQSMATPHPSLKQLFEELTDYTRADSLSEYKRHERDGGAASVFEVMESVIRNSLKNGGGKFTPNDYGIDITPPAELDECLNFEELALMLCKAMSERICNGRSELFYDLHSKALALSQANVGSNNGLLLSKAWEEFKVTKEWGDKAAKNYQRLYEVMLAYWGDVDINTIDKNSIKELLSRYQDFPKRNNKPFNKMSLSEIMQFDVADIADEKKIAPKSVKELLKLCQGFFSAFLADEKSYLKASPTLGVKYAVKSPSYAAYSDSHILKVKEKAQSLEGWKKWVILLAIYTGARRGDIKSISASSVRMDEDSGRYYIWIEEGKTDAAQRPIPIHKELIKLGFMEFIENREGILFPEVDKAPNRMTSLVHRINRELGLSECNDKGLRYSLHSFRHTFITKVQAKGITTSLFQTVVGHQKSELGISQRYTHEIPVKELFAVVDSITDW
ncbi:tyrosine-type recombinase/integrase [Agarivorans litoreus]|uniref:tyrosine-type recombinase/integrase n=1 Tax=Agarivorans litoreus TaxID=1510455 RepID=UPI001C7CE849|nr:tyrosine-type recombinase/integrase [Agarivorans litoreus]